MPADNWNLFLDCCSCRCRSRSGRQNPHNTLLAHPEEWRRVEGLKWPVRIRIAAAGQDMLFAADEVALNSSIGKDVFEVPEDIRKLAETRSDRAGGMPADMQ